MILGSSVFSFDGTTSAIIDLRNTLQCVQGNNPRSISFMIQTTVTSTAYMLSTGSQVASKLFGICINSVGKGALIIDINNIWYGNGKVINDGLWHTVLVTYDGTALSIYVDGRLDSTTTYWSGGSSASITSTLNTIGNSGNYLGSSIDGFFGKWSGKLKNVIFFDYVISSSYALANSFQAAGSLLYTSGNYSYLF